MGREKCYHALGQPEIWGLGSGVSNREGSLHWHCGPHPTTDISLKISSEEQPFPLLLVWVWRSHTCGHTVVPPHGPKTLHCLLQPMQETPPSLSPSREVLP